MIDKPDYIISFDIREAILQYFQKKPLGEVFEGYVLLKNLPLVPQLPDENVAMKLRPRKQRSNQIK